MDASVEQVLRMVVWWQMNLCQNQNVERRCGLELDISLSLIRLSMVLKGFSNRPIAFGLIHLAGSWSLSRTAVVYGADLLTLNSGAHQWGVRRASVLCW